MSDWCHDKECAIEALQARQGRTLRVVLAINAVMFVVELAAGCFRARAPCSRIRSTTSVMR